MFGALRGNLEHKRAARRLLRLQVRLGRLRKAIPGERRVEAGLAHGLMSTMAALMAYLPTQAIGLKEGFWAAITAIAVVQTQFSATRSTARDQFIGAATGGAISLAVAFAAGAHPWSYAVAVVASVLACWVFNVASAARLAGSTATIILLVPHTGSATVMAVSRVTEVGWGVTCGIVVVWSATRLRRYVLTDPATGNPSQTPDKD